MYYLSWSIFLSNFQSKLDRISEQLEPDEVEDDYFRYRICWVRFAANFFTKVTWARGSICLGKLLCFGSARTRRQCLNDSTFGIFFNFRRFLFRVYSFNIFNEVLFYSIWFMQRWKEHINDIDDPNQSRYRRSWSLSRAFMTRAHTCLLTK